ESTAESTAEITVYTDAETIRQVQEALNSIGYELGKADGIAGYNTKTNIAQYKKNEVLSETSSDITDELLISLGLKEAPMDELTEGYLRECADAIDPAIVLKTGPKGLFVEREYGGEGIDSVDEFMWISIRMLLAAAKDGQYNDMTARFFADDCSEEIVFSRIEGINEFTSLCLESGSTDPTVQLAFPLFYKRYFGAHDVSVKPEKEESDDDYDDDEEEKTSSDSEVPEDYRNGYYWIYCNFDRNTCVIDRIDDEAVDLVITAENTSESGRNSYEQLKEALEMLSYICDTDPDSMPYKSISIRYTDRSDRSSVMYAVSAEKGESGWETAADDARVQPFADGFKM
ncbi:MAG: peptidoglycan-binding domain-containing protein, partial [Lachnospiraceae bacterium]|nr:peptidoglycan-binding domain-containing protein [Lachnospiraceae bacterium]